MLHASGGFTLLEVLISVVVLSIGLLGLAGLHMTALRNNQNSYFRSVATQLAYEMADRMRANVTGVSAGSYDKANGTNDDCEAAACTSAQMAGYDIMQWRNALTNQLPNTRTADAADRLRTGLPGSAMGVVCIDSTPDDGTAPASYASLGSAGCDGVGDNRQGPYAIKIWWDDTRSGAQGQRFVITVDSP
ncbi:type IV pilus modification protein PilV [Methylomagnum sp.]